MYRFDLNGLTCVALNVGHFTMNAATMIGSATPQERELACEKYSLDPDAIVFQMNLLYVDTGTHRVIIDLGDKTQSLMNALDAAEINPESITDVIITHGHWDHFAGGINEDSSLLFPDARYHIQRAEWDHWFTENNPEPHHATSFQKIFEPLKDHLHFLDGEAEIIPQFEAIHTPGHSPAHMSVLVGKQMICVADVLLNPVVIEHPEWTAAFDCWPEQVVETRQALLRRIVDENLLVSSFHFTPPGLGHVILKDDSYQWVPITD